MKQKKKEEKKQKRLNALNEEVLHFLQFAYIYFQANAGKRIDETEGEYRRRLFREKRQIIVDEILRNRKPSERVKRYRERNETKREESKKRKEEEKEEHKAQIKTSVSVGLKPQAERPPQLKDLIARMEKNNKMFQREEEKIKSKKIDRKAALQICRRNMDRFN